MRAVIQRVAQASVTVEQEMVGKINQGILALIGVESGDDVQDAEYIAKKIVNMRIFEDDDHKMNLSVQDCSGHSILAISQFTLLGDARKGRRPSFSGAELPEKANALFELTCKLMRQSDLNVQTGIFGADMKVELLNDGPVTILLDSKRLF